MKALMEKREALISELEALANISETEARAYTEDETNRAEEIRAEIAQLDATIAQAEEMRAAVNAAIETRSAAPASGMDSKAAINAFARGQHVETRANETTLTNSNTLIASKFSTDVIHAARDLANIANQISIVEARGEYKQIVSNSSYVVNGNWVAEAGTIGVNDLRWTTLPIGKFKYASTVVLTLELLQQSAEEFDVVSEVFDQFSRDFAYGLETGIIKGTGDANGQPTGLVSGGTAFNAQSASAITAAELIDIYHGLKGVYMPNSVWVMNNKTLGAIRKLTDSSGDWLFKQEGDFANGYAGSILGRPVLVSSVMDDIATGKKPIIFGDLSQGYKGVLSPDVTMTVLNELYAGIGARGVQGILWFGGKPVNNEAYEVVTMA